MVKVIIKMVRMVIRRVKMVRIVTRYFNKGGDTAKKFYDASEAKGRTPHIPLEAIW